MLKKQPNENKKQMQAHYFCEPYPAELRQQKPQILGFLFS